MKTSRRTFLFGSGAALVASPGFGLSTAAAQYDVAVVGGSATGVFAAIRAAEAGLSVVLVENNAVLGGTATAGMVPICVKTCPTGTMVFGEREEILKIAKERLAVVKKTFPKAFLANPEDVSVIYLLADDKDKYFEFAAV